MNKVAQLWRTTTVRLTAIFILGLAMFLSRFSTAAAPDTRRRLRAAGAFAVLALATWWNLGLTVQFGAGLMDRQRLELRRNAWQTFVTIPARLPDLAYRYVFEWSSFYRPPTRP